MSDDTTKTYLLAINGSNGISIRSMRIFHSYEDLKSHVKVNQIKFWFYSAWELQPSKSPRILSKAEKIDVGLIPPA